MNPLLSFLQKYSDVDIEFIKEFIEIREGDKKHDPFRIDLDLMANWLNMRKDNLKNTLVTSYVKKIDYILLLHK